MIPSVPTEQRDFASADQPEISRDAAAFIEGACRVIATEQSGLAALSAELQTYGPLAQAFSKTVATIMATSGRVIVTGIGKSGHVAHKIQATFASTGTPSIFVHPSEASHGDLGMIMTNDIVLALSMSGETSELADIVAYTRRFAIPLVALTARADSTLARAADISLILPQASEACAITRAPTTSSMMQLALGDALAVVLLESRKFSATDFKIFHPGGNLGAQLRTVDSLMHVGEALPLGPADMPLSAVILEMTRKAFGCMGVTDAQGTLIGLITDGDLRRALHRDLKLTAAADVMNTNPLCVVPTMLAAEALMTMNRRAKPITSLFVLDPKRRPVGIVHVHDLLRAGVA